MRQSTRLTVKGTPKTRKGFLEMPSGERQTKLLQSFSRKAKGIEIMRQCDNCQAWVEDVLWIEWPIDPSGNTEVFHVCVDCLDHLRQWGNGKMEVPEMGSPAAQRDYTPPDRNDLSDISF